MPVLMAKPPNGVARWPCHRNAKFESNRTSTRTCVDVPYDAGAAAMDTRGSKTQIGCRPATGIGRPAMIAGCDRRRREAESLRHVAAPAARVAPCQKHDHRHDHEYAFHVRTPSSSKRLKWANRTICPIERTASWPDTALVERAISARHASGERPATPRRAHAPRRIDKERRRRATRSAASILGSASAAINRSSAGRRSLRGDSERGRPRPRVRSDARLLAGKAQTVAARQQHHHRQDHESSRHFTPPKLRSNKSNVYDKTHERTVRYAIVLTGR